MPGETFDSEYMIMLGNPLVVYDEVKTVISNIIKINLGNQNKKRIAQLILNQRVFISMSSNYIYKRLMVTFTGMVITLVMSKKLAVQVVP